MGQHKLINLSILKKLQDTYQKDIVQLIDIFIVNTRHQLAQLHHALCAHHFEKLHYMAQELRFQSAAIGAIPFSHACLQLEIASQEHRYDSLQRYLDLLQNQFSMIIEALEEIKSSTSIV